MSITERKLRHKAEVRASIISAAGKTVEEEGWQALSIRKIAETIEYSVPVIYDHFENKEAILEELARSGFQLLNTQLGKAKAKYVDPELQIDAIAKAYWKFASDRKEYYQLMYGLEVPAFGANSQTVELTFFKEIILDTIKEIIARSDKKDTDPVMKFHSFWSVLHGLVVINRFIKGNKKNMSETLLEDCITTFISGIKK